VQEQYRCSFSISRGSGTLTHNVWEGSNRLVADVETIGKVLPEGYAKFAAGLFQADEGIPAAPAFFAAGATTNLESPPKTPFR
jgi:hypothetical protein